MDQPGKILTPLWVLFVPGTSIIAALAVVLVHSATSHVGTVSLRIGFPFLCAGLPRYALCWFTKDNRHMRRDSIRYPMSVFYLWLVQLVISDLRESRVIGAVLQ